MKHVTENQPIEELKSHYGIIVTHLTLLPLGADWEASVYKADTHGGKSYFVKLKRGHQSDISVNLLTFLKKSGIQQIIPSLKTLEGKLTHQTKDFTLKVFPFVEGQNGFCCDLSDDQWIALGKALKQIHVLEVPMSLKDQIRKEDFSSKWRDAYQTFDATIDGYQPFDETALMLQLFLKENRTLIHRLVKRAESLSLEIRKQVPDYVLCHSDIHGGNVLIGQNKDIYLVDWDEPILAPKERDLMFIGGGVANRWNKPLEEKLFYEGYGKTTINRTLLAYYRYERIVQDIVEFIQALLLTSEGGADRVEMFQHFLGMFEPNGVVEIALKTDIK